MAWGNSVKSNLFLKILFSFLAWRVFTILAAVCGKVLAFKEGFPYLYVTRDSGLPYWIWSFGNFDGIHYIRISQEGYTAQFTQAFFPLFPLIINFVSTTFGINAVLAGYLLANIFFVLALYFLAKLILLDFDGKVLFWSIALLLAFPTSFYFGAIYTESFFLFLVVASFYFARSNNFLIAGLLAAFASATRVIGILLLPALLFVIYEKKKKLIPNYDSFKKAGFASFSLAGLLSYIYYLWREFSEPLYFWKSQEAFGANRSNSLTIPGQAFWRYIKILTNIEPLSLAFFNSAIYFISSVGALLVLYFGRNLIRRSYILFSFLAVVIPTLSGTLSSMPRYILPAFGIFIILGLINSFKIKLLLLFVFSVLLFISTAMFTRGYWIA